MATGHLPLLHPMTDQYEFPINDPRKPRKFRVVGDPTERDLEMCDEALRFHIENPMVYYLLVGACKEIIREKDKYGISPLWENIRHWSRIKTTGVMFKLSNNHRPFYARLLMHRFPEFDGLFVIKPSAFDYMNYDDVP